MNDVCKEHICFFNLNRIDSPFSSTFLDFCNDDTIICKLDVKIKFIVRVSTERDLLCVWQSHLLAIPPDGFLRALSRHVQLRVRVDDEDISGNPLLQSPQDGLGTVLGITFGRTCMGHL